MADRPVALVAAGKTAAPMAVAFTDAWSGTLRGGVVAAPVGESSDRRLEFFDVGHPLPTIRSVAAGQRALALARAVGSTDVLLVLLSGGTSAALAVPASGLPLTGKVAATDALLQGGVAIHDVNCVRKHLSTIKRGWLAAASAGDVITLAVSDVVGPVSDDPAVIGSSPTAGDPTSIEDAIRVANRRAVRRHFPEAVRRVLKRGRRGEIPETPTPRDTRLAGSTLHVIGNRLDAVRGATKAASRLGYATSPCSTGRSWAMQVWSVELSWTRRWGPPRICDDRPVWCRLKKRPSRVTRPGRGGRNQELVLASARRLSGIEEEEVLCASIGTDGVDGTTAAVGALADRTTAGCAVGRGLADPVPYLDTNDAYSFFEALGDLLVTGPTQTNVGDL